MSAARAARGRTYMPGEFVPRTGIYVAAHAQHRPDHQVTAIRGEVFPVCRQCGTDVRFHLVHDASHMLHDMDFAGPDFTIGR
jgi:hypothetical protein